MFVIQLAHRLGDKMADYYKHSGTVPLGGLLLTICAGTIAALPLAFVYSYCIAYCPFAVISGLFTYGLCFAVGAVIARTAVAFEVRNQTVPMLIGIWCGTLALYVAWGTDAVARLGWPRDESILSRFDPEFLWDYMKVFYAKGFWGLGFGKAENLTGIMLAFVWAAEAIVVIGGAALCPWNTIKRLVYCEPCQGWASHRSDAMRVCVTSTDWLRSEVENGSMTLLATSRRATPADRQYVKVGLDCCGQCGETNCLDLWTVEVEVDKKGKKSDKERTLVRKLLISRESMTQLIDAMHRG